jgi:DNA-binding response OmpR family regulator
MYSCSVINKCMKIAVVENDTVFSSILMDLLRQEGHEVYLFDSIAEFGAVLEKMEPDVIITDLMLPGVSSGELIDFYNQFVCPVYVMSSIEEEDLNYFAERINAKGYFHKPFHSFVLLQELHEIENRIKN